MNVDKRLVRYLTEVKPAFFLTIILGLLGGIAAIGQAKYLSRVVNQVFLEQGNLLSVWSGLVLFALLSFLRAALSWGSFNAGNKIASRVKAELRRRLFSHLFRAGPVALRSQQSGELSATILSGVENLDAYFSQYLPQLFLSVLIPITIVGFVLPGDLLSGLVLLLTAPLIPIFMILIGKMAENQTRKQWKQLSRMSAYFLDVLQGLTTLKILGRSKDQVKKISRMSDEFRQTTMGVLKIAFLSALVLEMVATISTAVIAVEIGLRLLYGRLGFEQAFFILILAPEFYLPLRQLGARFHAGMEGVTAARRIFELKEMPVPGISETKILPNLSSGVAIRFEEVSFSYQPGGKPAVKQVSFAFSEGEKVALVGPSGSGKTTIVSLLLRFIRPGEGAILVNGKNIGRIDADEWRRLISWVPQNPYIFHRTVAENILLGDPAASREQVEQAARQANLHDFIQSLPRKYDTPVGEQGARLSGGQVQRLALARAFLKNAPLVLLDEATANLDPENEKLVQDSIDRLLKNRTALIVAHRLSTVYNADRILVLSQGTIRERGNHRQLVAKNGMYAQMVKMYGGAGV